MSLACVLCAIGSWSLAAEGMHFEDSSLTLSNAPSDMPSLSGLSLDTQTSTPRYLWVSDKLSFKPNVGSKRSSFASGAEFWSKNKWGVSGNVSVNGSNLFGVPDNSELLNIDVNRQLLRSKDKTDYLAVGLGWQSISIDDGLEADGPKLSLQGKYSLASRLQLYGSSAWFPELEKDTPNNALVGYKFEAGLLFKPKVLMPKSSLSLKAGVQVYDLNSNASSLNNAASSVFSLGTNLAF